MSDEKNKFAQVVDQLLAVKIMEKVIDQIADEQCPRITALTCGLWTLEDNAYGEAEDLGIDRTVLDQKVSEQYRLVGDHPDCWASALGVDTYDVAVR